MRGLVLLGDGPKYGLQFRQEFELRTGDVWPLNVGQVYTTLQRLERYGPSMAVARRRGWVTEGLQYYCAGVAPSCWCGW